VRSQEPKERQTSIGRGGGEDLEQALGDEAELDMAMVSRELAADGGAVGFRFAM